MELAFVFLVVVAGVAMIAFAGMGQPKSRRDTSTGDDAPIAPAAPVADAGAEDARP